tara:strand:+ start:335 stop:994 length:660 start_codon:yes stop_codon:yes gene_type:complete
VNDINCASIRIDRRHRNQNTACNDIGTSTVENASYENIVIVPGIDDNIIPTSHQHEKVKRNKSSPSLLSLELPTELSSDDLTPSPESSPRSTGNVEDYDLGDVSEYKFSSGSRRPKPPAAPRTKRSNEISAFIHLKPNSNQWIMAIDEDGSEYFVNIHTNEKSSWAPFSSSQMKSQDEIYEKLLREIEDLEQKNEKMKEERDVIIKRFMHQQMAPCTIS